MVVFEFLLFPSFILLNEFFLLDETSLEFISNIEFFTVLPPVLFVNIAIEPLSYFVLGATYYVISDPTTFIFFLEAIEA